MSDNAVSQSPASADEQRRLARVNRQARWALLSTVIAIGVISVVAAVIVSAVTPPLVAEMSARLERPKRTPVPTLIPRPTATPTQLPPSPTPDAQRLAVEARANEVMSTTTPLHGPVSGQLLQTTGHAVSFFAAYVEVSDFVAEADFINPDNQSLGKWDYGFLFRVASSRDYRFILNAEGRWTLERVTPRALDESEFTTLGRGYIPGEYFDLSVQAVNHVRLIVSADVVYAYVNSQFIAQAPVDKVPRGDIYAATGLWNGDSIAGHYTRFRNFTVWTLP